MKADLTDYSSLTDIDSKLFPASWRLRFPKHVEIEPTADGLVLASPNGRLTLRKLPTPIQSAIASLAYPGQWLAQLVQGDRSEAKTLDVAALMFQLKRLAERGWLQVAIEDRQQPLVSLEPMSPKFSLTDLIARPLGAGQWTLSRFANVHRTYQGCVLESPLAQSRLLLEGADAILLVHALGVPRTAVEVLQVLREIPDAIGLDLLRLLAGAGFLSDVDATGMTAEDLDPKLGLWEYHDLLFHSRSRNGRHDGPFGATFPGLGWTPPLPAVMPPLANERGAAGGETISLQVPDLTSAGAAEPSLVDLVAGRKSHRQFGAAPIDLLTLGHFLYRVGRLSPLEPLPLELQDKTIELQPAGRPYPSGGAMAELEIFPLVQSCEGLSPGLYHYDGHGHALVKQCDPNQHTQSMLDDAAFSAMIDPATIQVLLIVVSRFQRLSWKYSSIAYSLTLKHVGVLMELMYLTATAMRLAPTALGAGNADHFAEATGADYYEYVSVGDFLLGSLLELAENVAG